MCSFTMLYALGWLISSTLHLGLCPSPPGLGGLGWRGALVSLPISPLGFTSLRPGAQFLPPELHENTTYFCGYML